MVNMYYNKYIKENNKQILRPDYRKALHPFPQSVMVYPLQYNTNTTAEIAINRNYYYISFLYECQVG